MSNNDLKLIKKHYGENLMHFCRDAFATILNDSPGLLPKLILNNFAPNHCLYNDLVRMYRLLDFKEYINCIYNRKVNKPKEEKIVVEDPTTLLKKAGYTLYECLTEEDIQKFRKYYQKGEELCTFNGGRLKYCHVYFAVKDNVEDIKRANFPNPDRQDEYGTSIISIQFTRDISHTLSIKNRYNHHVSHPDATFSNDLDNIIPGLTASFAEYYGMTQEIEHFRFYPDGYVRATDGKFYRYLYEIDNIYYCLNNVIIDNGQVIHLPKEKYLLADYFIIDLVNKKISSQTNDSFPDTIRKIKKINVTNNQNGKLITITPITGQDIIIVLDKYHRIISLTNHNITTIPDNFLYYSTELNNITLDEVTTIGNDFLYTNLNLINISFPKVIKIGDNFLLNSTIAEAVNFPNLEEVGDNFMKNNLHIKLLELPNLITMGSHFLFYNFSLNNLNIPKLITIGNHCFAGVNYKLETVSLPNALEIGNNVFSNCPNISSVYLPKLIKVGDSFLFNNQKLTKINLPKLETVGKNFLIYSANLKEVILPNLKKTGAKFIDKVSGLETLYVPNLEYGNPVDGKLLKDSIKTRQKLREIFNIKE